MSDHRVHLITGCASGIGAQLAHELLALGDFVCATDIDFPNLQSLAETRKWKTERLLLHKLDVTQPDDWKSTVELALQKSGKIDVLMNVAGYLNGSKNIEATQEDINRHFDINTKGTIFGCQAVSKPMIERRSGHIINFGSMVALVPVPGVGIYSASKFAVRSFSITLGLELEPLGISVSLINPDGVNTPMLQHQEENPQSALTFSGNRLLRAEEVSDLVIRRVLRGKKLEYDIPAYRGWLLRIGNLFPCFGKWILPFFQRRGLNHQSHKISSRGSS